MVDISVLTVGTRYAVDTIGATTISCWADSDFHKTIMADFGVLTADSFPLLAGTISSGSTACFIDVTNNSKMCFGLAIVSLRTMFTDLAAHIVCFGSSADLVIVNVAESNFHAM